MERLLVLVLTGLGHVTVDDLGILGEDRGQQPSLRLTSAARTRGRWILFGRMTQLCYTLG